MKKSVRESVISAIGKASMEKEAALEREALAARAAHVQILHEKLVFGLDTGSLEYMLAVLCQQIITIGREGDGYPKYNIPVDLKNILCAALSAGVLEKYAVGGVYFCSDFEGISVKLSSVDIDAWNALSDFRRRQTWKNL